LLTLTTAALRFHDNLVHLFRLRSPPPPPFFELFQYVVSAWLWGLFLADEILRVGTVVQAVLVVMQLPRLAERMHVSTSQLLTTDPQTLARCILLFAAIVGFALAATRRWTGWPMAAVGLIGAELAGVLSGRWNALVNPVHQLLAGLWLGTLSIVVIAGMGTVLREGPPRLRGPMVADIRTRCVELAQAATAAGERGSCGPHPSLIVDGVDGGNTGAHGDRSAGESAGAATSRGTRPHTWQCRGLCQALAASA
jgi:hypothetical protein